jgi:chromosome segregation ATPase
MTDTIEPTEEQKQAAQALFKFQTSDVDVDDVARLLAEREHKLRRECTLKSLRSIRAVSDAATADVDQLRADLEAAHARIAELEGQASRDAVSWAALKGRERELEEREAAHLAQIKALREMLVSAPGMEMLTALGDVEGEGAK